MTMSLIATPATLSVTYPAPPGAVTVTVTTLDGVAVYTNAVATVAGNVASYTLTLLDTAQLNTLIGVFTSQSLGNLTARVELVGATLFEVADARAFDKRQLANATNFPDAAILAARTLITERFERICKVSFVPRYRFRAISGADWFEFQLPDQPITAIRSIATRAPGASAYVPYSAAQLAALDSDLATGIVTRGSMYYGTSLYSELRLPSLTVQVGYEYGYAQPPEPIRRAALIAVVNQLVLTNISERTTSWSDPSGAGTFRMATPGMGRNSWFGIPNVDAVLSDYMESTVGIA